MAGWPFLSMESKVMIIKRGQAKVIKRVTVWRETCRVIPQGIFLSALVTCAGLALFWNWLPKKKSFSAKCGHIIINVCLKAQKGDESLFFKQQQQLVILALNFRQIGLC
jgi:hypothetical protein